MSTGCLNSIVNCENVNPSAPRTMISTTPTPKCIRADGSKRRATPPSPSPRVVTDRDRRRAPKPAHLYQSGRYESCSPAPPPFRLSATSGHYGGADASTPDGIITWPTGSHYAHNFTRSVSVVKVHVFKKFSWNMKIYSWPMVSQPAIHNIPIDRPLLASASFAFLLLFPASD